MKIRVAQRGWYGHRPARTLDEVEVGIGCYWVELDGHRYSDVVGVDLRPRAGTFTVPTVHLLAIGAVEIVYLASDGRELGAVPIDASGLPVDAVTTLAGGTMTERPSPATLDDALTDRDAWRARALRAERDLALDTHGTVDDETGA